MKRAVTRWAAGATLVALFVHPGCSAPCDAQRSAPCRVAPRIDGVDGPDEWPGAASAPFKMAMVSPKGGTPQAREAEARFMNSRGTLYVALRVPDATRNGSLNPVLTDMVVLCFSRGSALQAGDDKRVLLPGAWADKHVTEPGRDADDPQRDGKAAMRWRVTPDGGEWFAEFAVPLGSRDPNDASATAGQRVRFNLVYVDRFSADMALTEIGGLHGGSMDDASGWGTLELAGNVGAEAPAPVARWLARLFPHTAKPGRSTRRLQRVDADEIDVDGAPGGVALLNLQYPGIDGKPRSGQARVFVPPSVREEPSRRVPLIHVAGYEIDDAGALSLLSMGYAVSTIHAHPLNPLGRGPHLDRAVLHAARRLPFVDPGRVGIQGGSAGGWMTLMLAADAFPLTWVMPDVPPINWGYNAAYIADNRALAGPAPGSDQPRMPVLQAVAVIADQAMETYGIPFDDPGHLAMSPLAHVDAITAPTLALFSTADMLVPVDQVGAEFVRPPRGAAFPAGFTTAIPARIPDYRGARTLMEALPETRRSVFVLPVTGTPARLGPDTTPLGPPTPARLPFSRTRPWSVVVVDEGPVEPALGHFKYNWAFDREPFRKWCEEKGVQPEQLTPAKLERLMLRALGRRPLSMEVRPGGGKPVTANLLDFPEAERADVLLGLQAFCAVPERARRFAALCARLPADLQALTPGEVSSLANAKGGRRP